MEFLDAETSKYGELGQYYQKFADLYQNKLWHQLTEELATVIKLPEFNRGRNQIDLYENFISKYESRLNQLKFVQIASVIALQYFPSRPIVEQEVRDAIGFMEFICEKRARLGEEAYLVGQMSVAELLVQLGGSGKSENMKKARTLLDEAQPVLASLSGSGAETVVNSSYYRVACEYYKVIGPADDFYKSCIQFLAYTPQETLKEDVQQRLAVDMSLAALIGEKVFNFGEVLAQPILHILENTEYAWLFEMLKVFSAGDIDTFSILCSKNKEAIGKEVVLMENMELLRQKVALLCLMQIIFTRPIEDRIIPLKEIAKSTHLDLDQVEWLLMKAMSKELIKGKIDQVEEVIHISWLKPRVLDRAQLNTLKDKLGQWRDKVDETLMFVESETPELFQ